MNRWTHGVVVGALVLSFVGAAVYRLTVSPRARQGPSDGEATDVGRAILARVEARQRVVGDLIAGRLSLLQAAAAFRDLNPRGPRSCPIREAFPQADSDAEAYCLSVLAHVSVQAPPEQTEELTRRLTKELDALRFNGRLVFPES
jgi:hypothetical protein